MLKGNKGFSILAVVLAILVLGIMGLSVAYLTAVGEVSNTNALDSTEAYYVAQAGAEYGIKQIYNSTTNTVSVGEPGTALGHGTYIISQTARTITSTGRVGNAKRTFTVTSPSEADCTPFDVSHVTVDDSNKLHHIYFNKTCLATTVIDKIQMSWQPNNGQKIEKVRIENTYVYNNSAGQGSGEILELADYAITTASRQDFSKIEFDNDINDSMIFTLVVIMSDGSSRSMTFTPED